ncbi:MAG: hypothetical protein ACK5AZ_26485 [Bryobacteraceae bacterium]
MLALFLLVVLFTHLFAAALAIMTIGIVWCWTFIPAVFERKFRETRTRNVLAASLVVLSILPVAIVTVQFVGSNHAQPRTKSEIESLLSKLVSAPNGWDSI